MKRPGRRILLSWIAACIAMSMQARTSSAAEEVMASISNQDAAKASDLLVDDGKVEQEEGDLLVQSKEMRATFREGKQRSITAKFEYLGPTEEISHLGNGEVRHQFGLKLRDQDVCNLLYVMWRFDERPQISLSMKRNPYRATHEECFDRGYANLDKPIAMKPVRPGESHVLEANLGGRRLTVVADGKQVWSGDIGEEAMTFDGPAGIRSDNARVRFNLYTEEN